MSMGKWMLCGALGLASATAVIAADAPAGPTTQTAEAEAGQTRKLFEPYGLLKTLTPEQTAKIEKIHKDFLEERKKLEAKQKDDITAVLTPAQVTELTMAEDKIKLERKEKSAERQEKKGEHKKPSTEPT